MISSTFKFVDIIRKDDTVLILCEVDDERYVTNLSELNTRIRNMKERGMVQEQYPEELKALEAYMKERRRDEWPDTIYDPRYPTTEDNYGQV